MVVKTHSSIELKSSSTDITMSKNNTDLNREAKANKQIKTTKQNKQRKTEKQTKKSLGPLAHGVLEPVLIILIFNCFTLLIFRRSPRPRKSESPYRRLTLALPATGSIGAKPPYTEQNKQPLSQILPSRMAETPQ